MFTRARVIAEANWCRIQTRWNLEIAPSVEVETLKCTIAPLSFCHNAKIPWVREITRCRTRWEHGDNDAVGVKKKALSIAAFAFFTRNFSDFLFYCISVCNDGLEATPSVFLHWPKFHRFGPEIFTTKCRIVCRGRLRSLTYDTERHSTELRKTMDLQNWWRSLATRVEGLKEMGFQFGPRKFHMPLRVHTPQVGPCIF